MAKSYNDDAFDCQVDACKEFFQEQLPCGEFRLIPDENRPENMKRFKGPIYDITGFDARQVVAVLSGIVNNLKCPEYPWKQNKTFYLLIQSSNTQGNQSGLEELFRLQASPKKYQKGNGIVFLRPRGMTLFKRDSAKSYEELTGALKANYDVGFFSNTFPFAMHIMLLFKNNAWIDYIPQATFEAYMILLFEIARRLVTVDNPSKVTMAYDVLPIGSAIARLVKLLALGSCRFENVFFHDGVFNCFKGNPNQRRKAIDNINNTHFAITKQEIATKEHHLEELRELFCFVKPPAKMPFVIAQEELERQFKNFIKGNNQKLPLSDAEYTTAFGHCINDLCTSFNQML